jgi:lysophospholipase L1-like esterase
MRMHRFVAVVCVIGLVLTAAVAQSPAAKPAHWIGTWAAAPQPSLPGAIQTFRNQTLRLIVHTSVGGSQVRIKVSNTFGEDALLIGAAHIARRAAEADIDPASDRTLKFEGRPAVTVPARSAIVSDPVDLDVTALSDLAISLFLPNSTQSDTLHILALQTSYVAAENGDASAAAKFPVGKKIHSWPFLTGVDVSASSHAADIVAFGSSLTDGDGTTSDANRRWPDVLAERLQKTAATDMGVLNEGIIGNRLLRDSPQQTRFGGALGEAALTRFERDVLSQSGVKYVIVGIGINDILMPGSLTAATEPVSAEDVISGYRELIARAHKKGVRIIGTTNPPVEDSFLALSQNEPPIKFYTPEKERVRQKVNDWIRGSKEFDAVIDFDQVVRDPQHPTRILPAYDSGDHLHPNDAGCAAEGNAVPLTLFEQQ